MKKRFGAVARHPITGRRFRVSAPTAALLASRIERIEYIRHSFAAKEMSAAQAHDQIRRMRGRTPVTLAAAAAGYAARESLAENTRRDVRSLVRGPAARLAPLELIAIDVNEVKRWLEQLRARQVAVSSISCYWRRLRAIARYAVEREWIAVLPWGDFSPMLTGRDRRERESCRDLAELARLLSAARAIDTAEDCGRHLEAKITTAVALGLRQGELAGLRWSDVRESEGIVVVARQYSGRPTKTRHRPKRLEVDRELFVVLAAHRARVDELGQFTPTGPIFPATQRSPGSPRPYTRGECLTTRSLRSVVELAGLPNANAWSPHSLRDTFATLESFGHGGDLATLAKRTRHRSLPALARYLRAVRQASPPAGFVLPAAAQPGPPASVWDRGLANPSFPALLQQPASQGSGDDNPTK